MVFELMIPVSPGELLDKVTILKIKSEKILDENKRINVLTEKVELERIWASSSYGTTDIKIEVEELYQVNLQLWNLEDAMRDKERLHAFDSDFIENARRVYKVNDLRAKIKKNINEKLGSSLVEEKNYQPY